MWLFPLEAIGITYDGRQDLISNAKAIPISPLSSFRASARHIPFGKMLRRALHLSPWDQNFCLDKTPLQSRRPFIDIHSSWLDLFHRQDLTSNAFRFPRAPFISARHTGRQDISSKPPVSMRPQPFDETSTFRQDVIMKPPHHTEGISFQRDLTWVVKTSHRKQKPFGETLFGRRDITANSFLSPNSLSARPYAEEKISWWDLLWCFPSLKPSAESELGWKSKWDRRRNGAKPKSR